MTRIGRMVGTTLAVIVLAVGLSSCEKKEGPMARAVREDDKAVESDGQKLEKAGQDIKNAAKEAKKDRLASAAERIERAGLEAIALSADVLDRASLEGALERVREAPNVDHVFGVDRYEADNASAGAPAPRVIAHEAVADRPNPGAGAGPGSRPSRRAARS